MRVKDVLCFRIIKERYFFLSLIMQLLLFNYGNSQSFITKEEGPSPINDYISLYQKNISQLRGNECAMYPSCSVYGEEMFRKHSFFSAFVNTSDRLLRCGHDANKYSLTCQSTSFKLLDFTVGNEHPDSLIFKRSANYFAYNDTAVDDQSKLVIKMLINNHFYKEAIVKIYEYEIENISDIEIAVNKYRCFIATDELEKLVYDYETNTNLQIRNSEYIIYEVSYGYYLLRNYQESEKYLLNCLIKTNDTFLKDKALLLLGLDFAQEKNYKEALYYYDLATRLNISNKGKNCINVLNANAKFKGKSKVLACGLSIIPGMGYLYARHPQTALSSLLVNGLLMYATYSNVKSSNIGMALLTGMFGFSFYIGNIIGSGKSAIRYNSNQHINVISSLKYNSNIN